jgi:hypothetical protein
MKTHSRSKSYVEDLVRWHVAKFRQPVHEDHFVVFGRGTRRFMVNIEVILFPLPRLSEPFEHQISKSGNATAAVLRSSLFDYQGFLGEQGRGCGWEDRENLHQAAVRGSEGPSPGRPPLPLYRKLAEMRHHSGLAVFTRPVPVALHGFAR